MSQLELLAGIVQSYAKGKAVVTFPDRGNVPSPPLSVLAGRSKTDKTHDKYVSGEPVWCLLTDNGESGAVIGARYTDDDPPPDGDEKVTRDLGDGTLVTYDRETKTLTVELAGPVTINVTGNAALSATGTVSVSGSTVELN